MRYWTRWWAPSYHVLDALYKGAPFADTGVEHAGTDYYKRSRSCNACEESPYETDFFYISDFWSSGYRSKSGGREGI